jgi:uncharacterized protein
MILGIEFDPLKEVENRRWHGISFTDAEQALRDPNATTIDDPDAQGEQRFISLGMDARGRVLIVVHTVRAERTRLISARKARKGEIEHYAERI